MSPHRRREFLGLSAAGLAGVAGCLGLGGSGADETDETDDEPAVEPADWRTEPITDVLTGGEFTLGGHDVPVVLHTFEIWCGSCRTQQKHLAEFREGYDGEVVGVDLNVDPNEGAAEIREHAEGNGYGWHFGISTPALTRGLVDAFSPKLASGPGSPVVVICPDGGHAVLDDVSTPAPDIEAAVREC